MFIYLSDLMHLDFYIVADIEKNIDAAAVQDPFFGHGSINSLWFYWYPFTELVEHSIFSLWEDYGGLEDIITELSLILPQYHEPNIFKHV